MIDPAPLDSVAERLVLAAMAEGAPAPPKLRAEHFADFGHSDLFRLIPDHWRSETREADLARLLVEADGCLVPTFALEIVRSVLDGTPAIMSKRDLAAMAHRVRRYAARRRALLIVGTLAVLVRDPSDDPDVSAHALSLAAELADVMKVIAK